MEPEPRHPLGAIPDPANIEGGGGGQGEEMNERCNAPSTAAMPAAYPSEQHQDEQPHRDDQLQIQQYQQQQPYEEDEQYRDERARGRPRHWSWEHFRAIGEPKPTTRRRPAQCLLCSLVIEDAR